MRKRGVGRDPGKMGERVRDRDYDHDSTRLDLPFLFQFFPQFETFDLYLAFPLVIEDTRIRCPVDGRTKRVGARTEIPRAGGTTRRTFPRTEVREVPDDMTGCTTTEGCVEVRSAIQVRHCSKGGCGTDVPLGVSIPIPL